MSDKDVLKSLVFELKTMRDKINVYLNRGEWVYSNVYHSWVDRFNKCINKYNSQLKVPIDKFTIDDWDYSSSQKTMRQTAVDSFNNTLTRLIDNFTTEIESFERKDREKEIPFYQIRKCFKMGIDRCPVNPNFDRNKVFIGMPFSGHEDSYNFGILQVLNSIGYTHFRADELISNRDIMCKVCSELQSCGIAIFNISGLNPNVMLELGLAYGIGKPVIIIKDTATKSITDIGSIEYVEYQHAYDLMQKLQKALEHITANF